MRVVRLAPRYLRNAERLGVVAGSARGRAVGRAISQLAAADKLPDAADARALVPPTGSAFVRRIPDRNLWLWYTVSDDEVAVIALTTDPPVPVGG